MDGGGTGVTVVDLGSTNGMLVNGARVTQASLDDGGTIRIGNTTMTVRVVAHADDADDADDAGDFAAPGDWRDDGPDGLDGWGGSSV
jgi:hypothetical protein